jgi:hypothetical protein
VGCNAPACIPLIHIVLFSTNCSVSFSSLAILQHASTPPHLLDYVYLLSGMSSLIHASPWTPVIQRVHMHWVPDYAACASSFTAYPYAVARQVMHFLPIGCSHYRDWHKQPLPCDTPLQGKSCSSGWTVFHHEDHHMPPQIHKTEFTNSPSCRQTNRQTTISRRIREMYNN